MKTKNKNGEEVVGIETRMHFRVFIQHVYVCAFTIKMANTLFVYKVHAKNCYKMHTALAAQLTDRRLLKLIYQESWFKMNSIYCLQASMTFTVFGIVRNSLSWTPCMHSFVIWYTIMQATMSKVLIYSFAYSKIGSKIITTHINNYIFVFFSSFFLITDWSINKHVFQLHLHEKCHISYSLGGVIQFEQDISVRPSSDWQLSLALAAFLSTYWLVTLILSRFFIILAEIYESNRISFGIFSFDTLCCGMQFHINLDL